MQLTKTIMYFSSGPWTSWGSRWGDSCPFISKVKPKCQKRHITRKPNLEYFFRTSWPVRARSTVSSLNDKDNDDASRIFKNSSSLGKEWTFTLALVVHIICVSLKGKPCVYKRLYKRWHSATSKTKKLLVWKVPKNKLKSVCLKGSKKETKKSLVQNVGKQKVTKRLAGSSQGNPKRQKKITKRQKVTKSTSRYKSGERVNLTCVNRATYPAANLSWLSSSSSLTSSSSSIQKFSQKLVIFIWKYHRS